MHLFIQLFGYHLNILMGSLLCLIFLTSCSHTESNEVLNIEFEQGIEATIADHPRLFFSKEDEAKILNLAEKEPLLENLIDLLRQKADEHLKSPLIEGEINLGKSREAVSRILTLSLAYRMFNEDHYAKKVEEELLNISKYESWHPEHFLDVAEMTTAVSIGYDWCYEQLSEETKKAVEQSIRNNAFKPAWPVYENGDEGSWAKRNTNWNVVTNSGLVTGALAVADIYPREAERIVQYAAEFTPNNIEHFAPNGVYYEGPAYWTYTNIYLSILLDNFERVLGSDFGLSSMKGVNKTAQYYINTLSPSNKVFNFADAHGTSATKAPIYFYHSKKFDVPEVAEFYRSYLKETLNENISGELNLPRFFFLSIPWFDNRNSGNNNLQKDQLQVYEGEPDILTFNGGNKGSSDDLYLIAKGGKPDMDHNQLDVGSFIVESQGIRWGIDLGSENYDLPNFWDYKPDGERWKYFRNSNLSHNTLNIDGKISYSRGEGEITEYNLKDDQPFGIYDISSSYREAKEVLRGFKMLSPEIMLVSDQIKGIQEGKNANWRFFTEANASVNQNVVELKQENKTFYLKTFSQQDVNIQVTDAKPNSPEENPIEGVKMIEISASSQQNELVEISVLLGKNVAELNKITLGEIGSIDQW